MQKDLCSTITWKVEKKNIDPGMSITKVEENTDAPFTLNFSSLVWRWKIDLQQIW
jgi:hypothetical protein